MVDEGVLTIFLAVTSLAVVIQTGILVGFYFLSENLTRQADKVFDATRNLLGPLQTTVESLQAVSGRLAESSSKAEQQLRQVQHRLNRVA
jgi:hypothetical protein